MAPSIVLIYIINLYTQRRLVLSMNMYYSLDRWVFQIFSKFQNIKYPLFKTSLFSNHSIFTHPFNRSIDSKSYRRKLDRFGWWCVTRCCWWSFAWRRRWWHTRLIAWNVWWRYSWCSIRAQDFVANLNLNSDELRLPGFTSKSTGFDTNDEDTRQVFGMVHHGFNDYLERMDVLFQSLK